MKKNLLAVFVLGFATLLLAGCMTNTSEKAPTDETVAEKAVVPVELQVVKPEATGEVADEAVVEPEATGEVAADQEVTE